MKYSFKVKIANKNYPLCIFYKVKTFTEYWYKEVSPMQIGGYDPITKLYSYIVDIDVTNWSNSNGGVEHNNLSCVGDGHGNVNDLPMVVYAFQRRNDPVFDWLDEPAYQHNPESYEGWDNFKSTQDVTEETLFLTDMTPSYSLFDSYLLVNSIYRVGFVDLNSTYSGQDNITVNFKFNLYDNTNTLIYTQNWISDFTQITTGNYRSSIIDYHVPDAYKSTTYKIMAEIDGHEFTMFTTEFPSSMFVDKSPIDVYEVFFDGNRIVGLDNDNDPYTFTLYSIDGGIHGFQGNTIKNEIHSVTQNFCQEVSPTTIIFAEQVNMKTMGVQPLVTYIGYNGAETKEVNVFDGENTINIYQIDEDKLIYKELNYIRS